MTDVQAILIKLFAQYPVAEIENGTQYLVNAFQANDYDEVKKLPGYGEKYNLVRAAKHHIERIERVYSNNVGDQALQCLNLLKGLRLDSAYRNEKYNVARDLVAKSLYQKWPAADKQTFNRRVTVFDTWTDFFISYTNRDATATNNRYKFLISDHIGWPTKKAGRESINYVARVIVKFLEQKNIRAFADFKTLKCGDDIEAEVLKHCQATIAFVQLIEDETLNEPPPPKRNWCFEEYNAFKRGVLPVIAPNGLGIRCFFTLAGAGELPAQPAIPGLYKEWYNEMARDLHIVLDTHNTKPFDTLRSKALGIAIQIVDARTQLYESMLSTWP